MTKYNLIFLLNEESELINLKKLFESLSGKVLEEQSWGKKTLAYPIKKAKTAFYYSWKLNIDRKKVGELREKLNFNEKLIRYLLLVQE